MASIKHLVDIDLNKNQLTNVSLQHLAGNPAASGEDYEGRIFYDSTNGVKSVKFHNGTSFVTLSTSTATGDITGVTLAGDSGTADDGTQNVNLTIAGGNGITTSASGTTLTAALDASLTTVTSMLNTSLVVGRDADNQIKFGTDNNIIFRVGAGDGVTFKASGEIEATKFDGALEGNADTATALASAVNIGGVSFDGSGSINLPGVNQSGNQNTSGTAAIATTVTVADESSDATCFPLFVTAATGNLAPKSGSNLTFNSDTGTLTAQGFDASGFTGDLTGDVTGNADTADLAAQITVADESSDTTCFPIFATAATGSVSGKTGSNLAFNSSSGALTATSFVGALTGNASGSAGTVTDLGSMNSGDVTSSGTNNRTLSIGSSKVTTAKINNSAVTTAKIAGDAVTNAKIANDAVDTENIADDAITAAKLNDNSVVNAALDTVAQNRIKGRVSSGTGNVEDLTAAQVRTMINVADGATAGKILQVQSTAKTDTSSFSIGNGGTSSDVVTVSITPGSSSNKILIFATLTAGKSDTGVFLKLFRGSTQIALGDSDGSAQRVSTHAAVTQSFLIGSTTCVFLDSPSTTSSTTYSIRVGHGHPSTQTVFINEPQDNSTNSQNGRGVTIITVQEVAG